MRANVTRAAEGFDRRSFTVAEILSMQDTGIISDDENFELIEGEIVPMQGEDPRSRTDQVGAEYRDRSRAARTTVARRRKHDVSERGHSLVEPDLVVYPKGIRLEEVKGPDILLAVEVALTSLDYDRGLKAGLYARHRVNELWVVEASQRRTYVHRHPTGEEWRSIVERGPDDALTSSVLPGFSLKLGSI